MGSEFCRALSDRVDEWIVDLFNEACGAPAATSVVAVGGYGRAELSPYSDIDLLLLHDGVPRIGEVAEKLWYPIWDSGIKLGHSVRTTREAMSLASGDLDTATSMLEIRHLAGDEDLTEHLRKKALALWRRRSKKWLQMLGERVVSRQRAAGEVAFRLEPDLKEGRGGLRDVHAIHWAEAADRVMLAGDDEVLEDAYQTLLAARVELHRVTKKPGDVLPLQEQDGVAAALDLVDADSLMSNVARAARTISWRSDEVWERVLEASRPNRPWRTNRDVEIEEGVVLRDGRVHLHPNATPENDPNAALRLAAVAAEQGLRIDRESLHRAVAEHCPLPDPWPASAREFMTRLLSAGPATVDVIEALDQLGLWVKLIPEWAPNQCRPQRNAYHRFTVDRHLLEAVVEASRLLDRVDRPDLLVFGALFHDIGKGYPGDHNDVGVELVSEIGPRMGFSEDDVDVLKTMVQHHLLLPDVATRRDLSELSTIEYVARRAGSESTVRLLGELTEADSIATGPAAWNDWKAGLVHDLVERTAAYFQGRADFGESGFPTPDHLHLLSETELVVQGVGRTLTVVAPDRPGLFSRVAGAVALHSLAVLDAAAYTHPNGWALEVFTLQNSVESPVAVASKDGGLDLADSSDQGIDWDRVVHDVRAALQGRLALRSRLNERDERYRSRRLQTSEVRAPTITFDTEVSLAATVIEVHAADSLGVLYRVTRTFAELDLSIQSAKVQTLGPDVVDSFYVVDHAGQKVVDAAHLAEIERALLFALRSDRPPG